MFNKGTTLKFKRIQWDYVYREDNISIKISPVEYHDGKKTYTVFADKWIYTEDIYTGSIRLTRHMIPTLDEAKFVATWYYNRILDYID